ncbi:ABC transporter ATP-binding protein [Microlunatus endophyticus]|uniref:ABC transporter ATP-binding protein n=1 Tax=Microlunatus endophyticus TaxID=1716077 RepID=A0A917W908_9ACTN|nr:ATP-binding cassette domain-containing protein [Microlunatus endophyticus]GGL81139.1 ABC transporter ATP-binding protein [Microlunatus endophyticus]
MLEITKINRSFGARQVLTDVSFDVPGGRITGFVGRNGAGKTTTMRIVLGVLTADSGEVRLDGALLTPADRRRFGYMPEERGLYPKMPVAEQLVYLARLHGLSQRAARHNTSDLLAKLELSDRAGDKVETLSLGNQQRAQIAAALVHDPQALILDEPFSGLDPLAVDVVLAVLRERAAAGVPVLFSSHQLDIVEQLCDDLVIIAGGTIRAAGPRDELRDRYAGTTYQATFGTDAGWLRDQPGITVRDFDGPNVIFDAGSPEAAQSVLAAAVARGPVLSFSPRRPRLAEIFKEVIQ